MSKADLPSAPTGTNLKRVQYDDRRKPSAGNLVTRFIALKIPRKGIEKKHTHGENNTFPGTYLINVYLVIKMVTHAGTLSIFGRHGRWSR